MDSQFISPISIEKFAAYLDGNLQENEKQEIETLIENSEPLQQLIYANESVDDTLEYNSFLNEDLPEEIECSDFEIPDLDCKDFFEIEDIVPWAEISVACDCEMDDNETFYSEDTQKTSECEDSILENLELPSDGDDIEF